MDSVAMRKLVLIVLGAATVLIAAYGVISPVPGASAAAAVLLALAAGLAGGVAAAHRLDPHQINLVQEKSYRITLKSVLATTVVSGVLLLGLLYGAAAVIGVVTAAAGYEPISFQLFADTIARLHVLIGLPSSHLLRLYVATAVATGLGFWLLYPYLPTQKEEVAGPAAFLAAGVYLLAAAAIFGRATVPRPPALALDAAIIAFWGHVFAVAYETVERYVP